MKQRYTWKVLAMGTVFVLIALGMMAGAAYAQEAFPLDGVGDQGSQWMTQKGARYAGLCLVPISFLSLAHGDHGGGTKKVGWMLLCVAGALMATSMVNWAGSFQ